ncbi:hypothetical protein BH683_003340 [Williamsia sp. 1138]|uniref:DUF3995 domain-containing protein n=1 Tax=Williamsia sp. 1138 TaxID=1903117 RepID=UPI000A0FA1DB|nr:DUF3995 domain-containing protein [Williamsia sp. 1138]OZG30560.1 hypothetical protein BH683_003340 [Williamsia sp. 1138]
MRRHQIRVLLRAIGGRWQLESVGRWAVELADEHPIGSGIGLGLLAVLKALAAVTPAFNERWQGHSYRAVRSCGWVGGVLLVGWGGLSTLSAWAVLAGLIKPSGGYDSATMIGHAAVWDPLFLVWGGALLTGLWVSGSRKRDLKNDPEISPIPDPAPSSEPPLRSALTVTVAACIA